MGRYPQAAESEQVDIRRRLLARHRITRRDDTELRERIVAQRSLEERGHIFGGRRRGDGESHTRGARLVHQPTHTRTQRDPTHLYAIQIERRLGRMQPGYQAGQPPALAWRGTDAIEKGRQALLAARHLQELAVKLAAPAELQSVHAEGVIERLAVSLLRICQCAVDIENQCLDTNTPHLDSLLSDSPALARQAVLTPF